MLQEGEVEPWQIFVNMFTNRTITISTQPFATVSKILVQIEENAGPRPNESRLIFGGKQLEPSRMLAEYGVQKGSTLHLVLSLSGGDRSLSRQRRERDTVRLFSRAHQSISTMIMTPACYHW